MKPLCIDLFCGLGGWAEGFLAEGYDVVGFDIERHQYGDQKYPAQLVLQDVLTLRGSQFREGVKQAGLSGEAWFNDGAASVSSRSNSRKAASAMIAKIPFELAAHIARVYYPPYTITPVLWRKAAE